MAQEWWQYPAGRGFLWTWTQWIRHSGVDYQVPCGTPILQPMPGTILHSGVHPWGGQIDVLVDRLPGYEQGPHVMTYLHTSAQYVQEGQKVTAGTVLGLSGQPPPGGGYGKGCHVHFEITHGNVAPYTTYSPSRNPSQSSYPETPVPYVNRLNHGKGGGGDNPGANCGPVPKASDFTDPSNFGFAEFIYTMCGLDHAAADNCGDVPQRNAFPDDASWLVQARAWNDCFNGHHFGGLGNPLDPLGAIANFIANIPHNIIRVGKIVFGFGLCAIGLVLAFLPDVGAGLATALGAPEFASAIRQGVSGGLGGAARGGIRAASLVPGRQRAATKQRLRENRAFAQARTLEAQGEARRVERARRTTAKLAARSPLTPTTRAQGGSGERGGQRIPIFPGRVNTSINQGNAPPRTGHALGFVPEEPPKEQERSRQESDTRGLGYHIVQTRNRRVRAIRKGLTRPPREQTARAKPSVQSQVQRAGQVKRKVTQAVKRRRGIP